MRVLQVTPHYPPAHVGGVEYYTKRLVEWLGSRHITADVVCVEQLSVGSTSNVLAVTEEHEGHAIHRLELSLTSVPGGFRMYWRDPAVQDWLVRMLFEKRPDVVHLHSGYLLGQPVLAAAARHAIPVVVTLHDLWFICPRLTMMHPNLRRCTGPEDDAKCAWCLMTERRRFRLADRWSFGAVGAATRSVLRAQPGRRGLGLGVSPAEIGRRRQHLLEVLAGAPVVLSPSGFVRDRLERVGFPAGRIRLGPYGLPASPPTTQVPAAPRARLTVGYFGQLAPHKGIHVLIGAARAVLSQALVVRVYGPERPHVRYVQELRRQARGDPTIRFEGAYDNSRVAELLVQLDVVVVPSVWHENWPFVVLEAQRAGVPVIASRVGGLPEMIRDGVDGLLFDAGDHRGLARHLNRLLTDPSLLARLKGGIPPVKTEDEEMSELLALYADCARLPSAGRTV